MKKAGKTPLSRPVGRKSAPPTTGLQSYREKYRASEKRHKELLSHLPVGFYRTTPGGKIIAANPALVRMLGYESAAELRKVPVKDLYVSVRDREDHLRRLEKRQTPFSDIQLRRKDGRVIWGRDYPRAITNKNGRIAFCDGILVDISAQRRSDRNLKAAMAKVGRSQSEREAMIRKLHEASITDELTGLYNRRGFFTIAREYIGLAARRKTKMFLLYIDMDGLKQINDTFGHHMGDKALLQLTEFLNRTFRSSDVKGRMGGDEFAIFPIDSMLAGVEAALARLQKTFDDFNASAEKPFPMSVSSGMAYFDPEHPVTIEELLMRADKLMYERKRSKTGIL
jgi:diguanylate cyclase (GGDEF)-like protein/PAS domain S-box-containing protein